MCRRGAHGPCRFVTALGSLTVCTTCTATSDRLENGPSSDSAPFISNISQAQHGERTNLILQGMRCPVSRSCSKASGKRCMPELLGGRGGPRWSWTESGGTRIPFSLATDGKKSPMPRRRVVAGHLAGVIKDYTRQARCCTSK